MQERSCEGCSLKDSDAAPELLSVVEMFVVSYPETKMQHSVLLVDTLPGLDHLRKEGFDYIQMSWFQDVVLRPGAEHLEGPSEPPAHLLFAEKLDFGAEAPLGPGRHAVVDSVGRALLQAVHGDWLPWGHTEQRGDGHTLTHSPVLQIPSRRRRRELKQSRRDGSFT